MKNITTKILLISTALVLTLALAACGESTSSDVTLPESSKTETTTAEEEKTIGEKSGADYTLEIVNKIGSDIIYFAVTDDGTVDDVDNMLDTYDVFESGESRVLYLSSDNEDEATFTLMYISSDYTDVLNVLHVIPVGDAEEIEINYDDESGLSYLTYQSTSEKKELSTLEAEKEWANAAAATEETTVAETYQETTQYVDPNPVQQPETTASGEDGCIGDAETFGSSEDGCIGDDALTF